jgi:hypothetical protein
MTITRFRSLKPLALLILVASALLATPLAGAQSKTKCSQEDAMKAEAEASTLQDWSAVYKSYKRFSQCDDASIGEGYSNSVVHLLASSWGQFDQLNSLASQDAKFETFVLRHIDELMSPDQAKKIRENALAHCTQSGKHLCNSIVNKLDHAAKS